MLQPFFDFPVKVRFDALLTIELVVLGKRLLFGLLSAYRAVTFQNLVLIKGQKLIHAFGKTFHGKGVAPLDNAFDIIKKCRYRPFQFFDIRFV